jgi:hypothetical protein
MKIKATILSISLLLVFLNACTNTETQSPTPIAENYWLQNLTCVLPCWQGIIPQQTKFSDVMSVVGNAKSPAKITGITTDKIDFQFQNITGSMHRTSNDAVDHITLNVTYQETTLQDLEAVIGQPEKISVSKSPTMDTCNAVALFEMKGIILDLIPLSNQAGAFDKVTDCKADVNGDSQIFRIILIGNTNSSELWKSAYSNLDYVTWRGYNRYP